MATEAAFGLSAVQQRASAVIAAQLVGTAATPWLYEMLPGGTRDVAHVSYGVGILTSGPIDPNGKQRAGAALNSVASVGVRMMYRIRADAMEDDYRLALATADLVTAGIITTADSTGANAGQKWHWDRTFPRLVGDNTFLLIEQTYTCWFHTSQTL